MNFKKFLKSKNFKDIEKVAPCHYKFSNDEATFTVFVFDANELVQYAKEHGINVGGFFRSKGFGKIHVDFSFAYLLSNYYYFILQETEEGVKPKIDMNKKFNLVGCKRQEKHKYVPLNNTLFGLCKGQNENNLIEFLYTNNFVGAGVVDDNLGGVLDFYIELKKKEMRPIIGREFITNWGSINLYPVNYDGFKNLMYLNYYESYLVKKGYEQKKFRQKLLSKIFSYSKDLICVISFKEGTAGFDYIINNDVASIDGVIGQLKQSFEHLFVGLEYYIFKNTTQNERYQRYFQRLTYYLKHNKEVQPVLFNRFLGTNEEAINSNEILTQITNPNFKIQAEGHRLFKDEEVNSFFEESPLYNKSFDILDIEIWKNNSVRIAHLCNLDIPIGHYDLPKFEYKGDKHDFFLELVMDGFKKKIGSLSMSDKKEDEYIERLENELNVIVEAGFIDYFLIIWDIIKYAKVNGVYCGVARGSVAGSLVAYCLDITGVDPIKYDLLFERFLNKARLSKERAAGGDALPDIDMDFESAGRDKVKHYIIQKYGLKNSCSIGTYGKLQTRAAIKDIGKLYGLSFDYCNRITKRIFGNELENLYSSMIKSNDVFEFVIENPTLIKTLVDILSLPKNSSIHPAGMIIVPKGKKLYDFVPVKWVLDRGTKQYELVSEWEGKYIDKRGILKVDVLGIKQLDVFKDIEKLIYKRYKKTVTLDDVIEKDLKNKKVYKEFSKGTEGVFQYKSQGLKQYMKKMRPTEFEDLVAANALYRPGAMEFESHLKYIKIKRGEEPVVYDHPLLEPVTKKTLGLFIYQEQIMQAAVALGKLSMEQADMLRTYIKKFDNVKMKEFGGMFIKGAMENGCSKKKAELIWNKLLAFSGYGFNKSHSASYSMLGYYCQWLKVKYPLEFFAVNMNYCREDELGDFILRMKDFEIELKYPDVNLSGVNFVSYTKTNSIVWALKQVKGVGIKAAYEIVRERENGKFKSVKDFFDRVPKRLVNKRVFEALIFAGCFDKLYDIEEPKGRYEILKYYHNDLRKDKEIDLGKRLDNFYYELQAKISLGISGMFDYELLAKKWKVEYDDISSFIDAPIGSPIDFIGMIVAKRKVITRKKQQEMMIITLDNNGTMVPLIAFPTVYENKKKFFDDLQVGTIMYCNAKKQNDDYKNFYQLIAENNTKYKTKNILI